MMEVVMVAALITIGGQRFDAIEVVVPDETPPAELLGDFQTRAADDLTHYLEQITGIKPMRSTGNGEVPANVLRIWVGTAAVDLPKKLTHRFDPQLDGYLFEMQDRRLVLAGTGSGRGTYYAVCDFLHHLGVRWFFPGPNGEHVPKSRKLIIDKTPGRQVPDFPIRMLQFDGMGVKTSTAQINAGSWAVRNRLRHWESGYYGHNQYVSKEAMAEHPEWKSMINGQRAGGLYCTSNPEFVAKAIEQMTARVVDQGEQYIEYSTLDTYQFCQCEACLAQDTGDWEATMGHVSVTDRLLHFKNQVAAAVGRKNPRAHLGVSAYLQMTAPPLRQEVHPNIVITYIPITYDPWHAFGDPLSPRRVKAAKDVKRWCQLSDKVITYEYEPNIISQDLPNARVGIMARNARFLKKIGVKGTNFEGWTSLNAFGSSPVTTWARTRLLWDATADPGELIADYCHAAYGPGGDAMARYFGALDNTTDNTRLWGTEDWGYPVYYTARLLDELQTHMLAAAGAVKHFDTTEPQRNRFEMQRLQFEYLKHYMAMRRATDRMEYARALNQNHKGLALLSHVDQLNPIRFLHHFPHSSRKAAPFTVVGWQDRLRALTARVGQADAGGSAMGQLVAALPKYWRFQIDPQGKAIDAGWTAADFDDSAWKSLSTTLFWCYQWPGLYNGQAVYRATVHVDEKWAGRTINFTNLGMFGSQELYVNGRHIASRDWNPIFWVNPNFSPWDVDVTDAIRPGRENQITIVVNCPVEWGGSSHRMFLWSPI